MKNSLSLLLWCNVCVQVCVCVFSHPSWILQLPWFSSQTPASAQPTEEPREKEGEVMEEEEDGWNRIQGGERFSDKLRRAHNDPQTQTRFHARTQQWIIVFLRVSVWVLTADSASCFFLAMSTSELFFCSSSSLKRRYRGNRRQQFPCKDSLETWTNLL